jgi:hypothetical protein
MSTTSKLGAVMCVGFIVALLAFWYLVPGAFEDPAHVLVFMCVAGIGCAVIFIVWIIKTIADDTHSRHLRNREAEECVYRAFQNNGFGDATLLVVQYAVCEKHYFVTMESLRLCQGIFPPLENYMEFKEFSKEVSKVLPKTWHKYTEDEMREIDKKQQPVRHAYDALMTASMDLVVAKEFLTGMGEYYTIERLQLLKDMYAATASHLAGNKALDFTAFTDVFHAVVEQNDWRPLSKDKMERRDRKQRRADMKTEVGEAYDSDEVNADECNNDANMAASLQAAEVAGANADRSQARKQRMQAAQATVTSARECQPPEIKGEEDKGGIVHLDSIRDVPQGWSSSDEQDESSDDYEDSEAEQVQGGGDHDGYEQHDHVDVSMMTEDRQAVVAAIDDQLAALGHGKPGKTMVPKRSFQLQRNDSAAIRTESSKSYQHEDDEDMTRVASHSGGRIVV